MQDPFAWSIPFGRLFGINIRIHFLFPFVALALILRASFEKDVPSGVWIDASIVMGFLFFSVLLHEFGHCFAARSVNGDAREVMLWPLGGLANVEVPNTPRANFITAAGGPAVNLVLGLAAMLVLWLGFSTMPNFSLAGYDHRGASGMVVVETWGGERIAETPYAAAVLLRQFFWVNYIGFLLNVLLIGYPLDGGRMFQAALWPWLGHRRSTLAAVFAGFVVMFVIGLYAIVQRDPLFLCLAIFIYVSCKQQWLILESGSEESLFGYDFSQGYTSLERDEPPTLPPRRESWWKRWKRTRAEKKEKEETQRREAEETRLDQLLDKVAREGLNSLTDEERRFMQRVSDRYRNRNRG